MGAVCSGLWQAVHRRGMDCAAALGGIALAVALSGCVSFSYLDGENVRHIIGFTDIADVHDAAQNRPSVIAVTTVGVSAYRLGEKSGFALGYNRDVLVSVPNNSCVDLNRIGPCYDNRPAVAASTGVPEP